MASISGANLTLTTVGSNVTVNLQYNANFTPFERFLGSNGMLYRERVTVLGLDPDGGTTGTPILTFLPLQNFPVTAGAVPQIIPRTKTISRPRADFQEDVAVGDADSIRCRIEIIPVGFPAAVTGHSDVEVLLG